MTLPFSYVLCLIVLCLIFDGDDVDGEIFCGGFGFVENLWDYSGGGCAGIGGVWGGGVGGEFLAIVEAIYFTG